MDWRTACLAWLRRDDHRYVAFHLPTPVIYDNLAGIAWDDSAEAAALIILTDTITDAVITGAKQAVELYEQIELTDNVFALIVVPAGHGRAVADDAIAVAEWTGERVSRV